MSLLLATPAPAADFAVAEIEEVLVTALKRPVARAQLAYSIDVVDDVSKSTHMLITDALAAAAGVELQQTTPGQGAILVRGQRGSSVLHLVDGMRLNNAIFRSAPTQYFALVPGIAVERIEIIRGTPTSLYGSDAIGGVAQVVSYMPQFSSNERQSHGVVTAALGSAESLRRVAARMDAGSSRLYTSFGVDVVKTGDRRIGGDVEIKPSGFSSRAARWLLGYRPDPRRSLSFDMQYLTQPETPRIDELIPGFGQSQPSSSEFLFAPNTRLFAHGRYTHGAGYLGADWTIDAAWQRIDDDRITRDFLAPVRTRENNRSDLYGVTVRAAGSTPDGSWVVGVEYYDDTVHSRRVAEDLTSAQTTIVPARFPDGSTVRQAAVYGNVSRQLGEVHALSIGVRASSVRTDVAATSVTAASRRTNNDISGDIGWVMNLDNDWQLVSNVGFGFRAPNIFDVGSLGARPGNRFNVPNAGLESERVIQGEVGARRRAENLSFEFVVWSMRYTDRISSVLTGATTPDGRDIVQSVNAAKSTLWGFETALAVPLAERWWLRGNLGYTWGEQTTIAASEPADRIPPLSGLLRLDYEPSASLSAYARLRFADRQNRLSARDVRDNRINPAGSPGWSAAGVGLQWHSGDDWLLTLALDNVFDTRYRTHGSGLESPGRNLLLSITREW